MDGVEIETMRNEEEQDQKLNRGIILRWISFICAITAAILMLTNKQSTLVNGINLEMKFYYFHVFVFFAVANLIVAVLSVLSWFMISRLVHKTPNLIHYIKLFLFDLVIFLFLGYACVTAATFEYVWENGNSHIGWVGFGDHFDGFRDRTKWSFVLSFTCLLDYLVSTIFWVYACENRPRILPI